MTKHLCSIAVLALLTALPSPSQTAAAKPTQAKESAITMSHAKGTFEVKMTPAPADDTGVSRFRGDKQFRGDLDGSSVVVMLAAGNPATGSAGYVAMENESGTMDKGALSLTVLVVPGSGTGDLQGISGKMDIVIADGKHSYDLEYSLPAKP